MNNIESIFNACMHKKNCIELQSRIAQLESQLKTVSARYNYVRNMTPKQFENTSIIHEDFDRQIDAMIKEKQ